MYITRLVDMVRRGRVLVPVEHAMAQGDGHVVHFAAITRPFDGAKAVPLFSTPEAAGRAGFGEFGLVSPTPLDLAEVVGRDQPVVFDPGDHPVISVPLSRFIEIWEAVRRQVSPGQAF